MPKGPPAAGRVGHRGIVRVFTKEMAIIGCHGRHKQWMQGQKGTYIVINLDEILAGLECGSGTV